ncbi:voltage-gated potassium channel [Conidiobolus coronatus NRRL 28638]|uniref:Voltage-gated potassium channel n=1 Tax=Conidiobolus coronatus (strain ATCC 28846 / CBS 209.66 / NRRL 28638) TaxID=796925 RepID=A0A137P8Y3_CONC2|nr:voltage-gated potassium channel [Conidiobolus coronatus NRRL 28638]|eukprot:KXN71391.1 voltage-gated potassium channel [Conidiobolus coronatus NRRL 28638]
MEKEDISLTSNAQPNPTSVSPVPHRRSAHSNRNSGEIELEIYSNPPHQNTAGLRAPYQGASGGTSPNYSNLNTPNLEQLSIVAEANDNIYATNEIHEETRYKRKWKRDLYLLLEDASSSRAAFIVNIFVTVMIFVSVFITTIETIPSIRRLELRFWNLLELAIMVFFTIELLLRFLAHSTDKKQMWKFLTSPLTIIDIIAVVPYYVMLILHRDTTVEFRFNILRIFRIFRVFRAFKYSSLLQLSIEVMILAVKKSLDALAALIFFMLMTILIFSTFLYFAERGTWDDQKKEFVSGVAGSVVEFDSIPAAFWFVIATITTTGYGDIVPSTFIGKLIAFPLMVLGILLIALPSVIVGRNFTVVWDVLKHKQDEASGNADSTEQVQYQLGRYSPQLMVPNATQGDGLDWEGYTGILNRLKVIESNQAALSGQLQMLTSLLQNSELLKRRHMSQSPFDNQTQATPAPRNIVSYAK